MTKAERIAPHLVGDSDTPAGLKLRLDLALRLADRVWANHEALQARYDRLELEHQEALLRLAELQEADRRRRTR